jgi:6-pyruvoyltetrahydropterin/6-carboxytetrahydropterin synthase
MTRDGRRYTGFSLARLGRTHVNQRHSLVLGRPRASRNCDEPDPFGQRSDAATPGRYDYGMTVTRRVTVERNRLRFAAAHMATFGGACEPLHGHNYDVLIELEGDLTEDSWVWDFGAVKRAARAITDELDHHFLLQRDSKHLHIAELGDAWEVAFRDKRYVFPRADVYPLPLENTTAECISEWFAGRLLADLRKQGATNLHKLSVGIEEMPGQAGWYTVEMEGQA